MSEYIISIKDLAILMAKCHGTKLVEEDGTPVCDQKEIAEGIDKPLRMEEIVRCRHCKHYDRMNDDEGMCMVSDDNGDYARWMVDDVGYCYLGERRGE